MSAPYLSAEQVFSLNDKHGWFHYGDAQGNVSQAFAQDAIEMHERMRASAPQMLAELRDALTVITTEVADGEYTPIAESIRALIKHVTGVPA